MICFSEVLLNSCGLKFPSLRSRGWGDIIYHAPPHLHHHGGNSERKTVPPVETGVTCTKSCLPAPGRGILLGQV